MDVRNILRNSIITFMEAKTKKLIVFLILPLALLSVVVLIINRQSQPDFLLHVDFLDVGQGDAIFIQTYLGNQILIDGGPSSSVLAELGEPLPPMDRSLDMVI